MEFYSFKIEYMKEEDIKDVLRIEQDSFSMPWSREMFLCELTDHPFSYLYVAKNRSNKILGYICYWLVFDEMNILNLAVHKDCRRKGIASDMIRFALMDGVKRGAGTVILEVRSSNKAAIRLYEKFGFKEAAVRKGYYDNPREDALLMMLDDLSTYGQDERYLKAG